MLHSAVEREVMRIADDYFGYLAANFPVMCASDEFPFLPRATKSIQFLSSLDIINKDKINGAIGHIRSLRSSLERLDLEGAELDTFLDVHILKMNMASFLHAFGNREIWKTDPLLYLKIVLFGIDQIISQFSPLVADAGECLKMRLAQIPSLLHEAKLNLKRVSLEHLEKGDELVSATINYLKKGMTLSEKDDMLAREGKALAKKAVIALDDFRNFLRRKSPSPSRMNGRRLLTETLKETFAYNKELEEVFEIAHSQYCKVIGQLKRMAKKIDPHKRWQEVVSTYKIEIRSQKRLREMYVQQIQRLQDFLHKENILEVPRTEPIAVMPTPEFMKPIRASASYRAPLTTHPTEPAYFYITDPFSTTGKPKATKSLNILHKEYIFVTAHETYPGHHLLDSRRRHLANPIRSQIESPFFYEGWASYAERLIDELGYIQDPIQRLIGLRREAWRSVRAMSEVGVRIKRLNQNKVQDLLIGLGYRPASVKLMVRHYMLSCGYQLCYTIGKHEILQLRKKFAVHLGLKEFHERLLALGEIPFDLIRKAMTPSNRGRRP